jgi:hypothetical protein
MSDEKRVNPAIQRINLIFGSTLPGPQKLLLLSLSDRIGSDKTCCWPSQRDQADRTSTHRATVNRLIRALVRAGVVTTEPVPGSNNKLYYSIDCDVLCRHQRERRDQFAGQRRSGRRERQTRAEPQVVAGDSRRSPAAATLRPADAASDDRLSQGVTRNRQVEPPQPDEPSHGPLPIEAGRGPRDERGEVATRQPKPPAGSGTFLDQLSDHNRATILDVQREVSFTDSRADPIRLGLELNELLDAHDGVDAADIIEILRSKHFSGLRERSWGLLLFNEGLFTRFSRSLAEAVNTRKASAAAVTTSYETIAKTLGGDHVCDRMAGVNGLADRFERTGDPACLLRLAAVFSGKGRDPLLKVRLLAIDRLSRVLSLHQPQLPDPVRNGIALAVRKAATDESLRPFAEFITESLELPLAGVG